jgi:uncharacterized protein
MNDSLPLEIRRTAMFCHLSALGGILLSMVIPIPGLGILIPYSVWQQDRDRHPFIMAVGKEVINFQISCLIYSLIATLLIGLSWVTACGINPNVYSGMPSPTISQFTLNSSVFLIWSGVLIGLFLLLAIGVQIGLIIFAATRANRGEFYLYPWTLRFLR